MKRMFSLPLLLLASLHPQSIHVKTDRKPCTETVRKERERLQRGGNNPRDTSRIPFAYKAPPPGLVG